jgi:serine/threonine-protein kinase
MSQTGEKLPGAPAALVDAGDIIAGKYRVDRVLGEGGMATVYAAMHLELHEPVALKLLKPAIADSPPIVQRFLREARAAVRIKSEHVARVLDVGTLEGGAPYMVMEMLVGEDLRRVCQARGPLPVEDAVVYVIQACEALAEAHLYGIVHRDLKPANLFLSRRSDGSPLVKVLDFGISKMADETDQNLTATTDVLGSPLYMSPEQIRSPRDVDHRADIWALGAVLYKMLTGVAAFRADTASASLARIIAEAPVPVRSIRPDVPPALEVAIVRCLEKDVTRRYQRVDELVRALLPFAPGAAEAGTSTVSRARRRLSDGPSIDGAAFSEAPAPRARRTVVLAAAASLLALLALGLTWTWTRTPPGPALAATAPSSASAPVAPSAAPLPAPSSAAPLATAAPSASAIPTASASAAPAPSARPVWKGAPRSHAFDDRL